MPEETSIIDMFVTHLSVGVTIGVLGSLIVFVKHRQEVRKLRAENQQKLIELDHTSKTLVRRDFELSQTLETLREMDQAKTHFVTVAAHQLRTPLSAVKWTLRLFLDGDLGQVTVSQTEYLQACYETNERMIKLVNDLLNVSRIESGRFSYSFQEEDVLPLVKEVLRAFANTAKQKNVELILEKNEDRVTAVIDKDKIIMVAQNLVENAISYTPNGGKVFVTIKSQGSKITISVKDTGIGITSEEKKQIFTKFYRSEGAIKMFPNGSGLGLFLSQNIALRHGGVIEVESEVGNGSTFSVVIPKKGPLGKSPVEAEMKNFVQGNNHK
jgi:signal transduction histidine kinase